jgi:hypothetical protein
MIIQDDTVMYKMSNNQPFPKFHGTRNNYNSEGEDSDYINDVKVLNNQQLKDQYYKTYIARTQNKLNISPFKFLEVQKILESFGPKCDLCNINEPVKDIFCEDNHKVYYFRLIFILFIYF